MDKFRRILLVALIVVLGVSVRGNLQAQFIFPPHLNCASVIGLGNILVEWTLPTNSCGPFIEHNIYRSTSFNGPYTLIANITNQFQTSYVDPVSNGNLVTYYYYMSSAYGCPGATILNSDTIDNLDPPIPVINYVTVNNGFAVINWQPTPPTDTYGYIIYRHFYPFINDPIDTLYDASITTYLDPNSTPSLDSMGYTVAAIDSCINTGQLNEMPQFTIHLQDTVIRCSQTVILDWTPYINWPNGVLQYDLYLSQNGSPAALYQTYDDNVFIDTLTGFNDGDQLCFTIVALQENSSFISTSNEVCVQLNIVQQVNDFYVRNVDVVASNTIEVQYSMDPLADVTQITLQRGVDGNSFTSLATFPPPDLSVVNSYFDTTALTGQTSYFYRLIAADSCNVKDTSSIGQSLLLGGYAFSDLTFFLQWNPSFLTYETVQQYDVYRDVGSGFTLLSSFTPDILSYEESQLLTTTEPCYYIEARDSMNFPNGLRDQVRSRSNILCLNQPSQIYMPNAFAPLGKNNELQPILNVEGPKNYSFVIFNRWGEQIFFSQNQSDSWDGKYQGTYVQQGVYAYVVEVTDENGQRIVKKGTVMVIR